MVCCWQAKPSIVRYGSGRVVLYAIAMYVTTFYFLLSSLWWLCVCGTHESDCCSLYTVGHKKWRHFVFDNNSGKSWAILCFLCQSKQGEYFTVYLLNGLMTSYMHCTAHHKILVCSVTPCIFQQDSACDTIELLGHTTPDFIAPDMWPPNCHHN